MSAWLGAWHAPRKTPVTSVNIVALIGKRVEIVFDLLNREWPISGYPAVVTVVAVDMPLINLGGQWVNVSAIRTIRVIT